MIVFPSTCGSWSPWAREVEDDPKYRTYLEALLRYSGDLVFVRAFDRAEAVLAYVERMPAHRRLADWDLALIALELNGACGRAGGFALSRAGLQLQGTAVAASVTSADLALHKLIADSVRVLAAGRGITHVPQRPAVRKELSKLGQMLLFDKILSGNRNISCMSCHPPRFGTTDRLSLSIGEGASIIGPGRKHPQNVFIPRNSPALFNVWVFDKPVRRWTSLEGRCRRDSHARGCAGDRGNGGGLRVRGDLGAADVPRDES